MKPMKEQDIGTIDNVIPASPVTVNGIDMIPPSTTDPAFATGNVNAGLVTTVATNTDVFVHY